MDAPIPDPYGHCTQRCHHDLGRGVGIAELLEEDGPYPPSHLLVNLSSERAVLIDDEQEDVEGLEVLPGRLAV